MKKPPLASIKSQGRLVLFAFHVGSAINQCRISLSAGCAAAIRQFPVVLSNGGFLRF